MRNTYWHIQMFLPEGKNGMKIDSSKMLKESQPIIGTGEWDDLQCRYFKGKEGGLSIGDIIMVREGSRPLALCEIIGDCYHNDELTNKYINYWFRPVKILGWATNNEWNTLFSQGTLKKLHKRSNTDSWNYINDWYKQIIKEKKMKHFINLLEAKHQIILQGAPGTGKTYIAKDIAEKMIFGNVCDDKREQATKLTKSDQFKLIQFHPSYTYEDFVRGIVVSTEDSEKPQYLTVNKVLGEFAENALKNWKDSQKDEKVLTEENIFESQLEEFKNKVIEENATNAGTYYSIKGTTAIITDVTDSSFRFTYDHDRRVNYTLLFSDLRKLNAQHAQLSQVKDVDSYELEMKQKASYYYRVYNEIKAIIPTNDIAKPKVDLQNYVLIIDEINRANLPSVLGELIYALEYRGQAVETMYKLEDGDNKLALPPNLYIIGTMNTADRSIGQIDYAIRRRFAFVDVEARDLSSELGEKFNSNLFHKVKELFNEEYLSSEFEAKDVQLGHSYFITNDKNTIEMRLEYEIKPILREYIRDGILKENVKDMIGALKND